MKPNTPALFAEASAETLVRYIAESLAQTDESPFWAEKIAPFCRAILSVLVPLREQHLLFTPEGSPEALLTPELFLRWCDLVSLKTLAFTLQRSNASGRLERTLYDEADAARYEPVDLELIGKYLSGYMVDLDDEQRDFPIAHYNLHTGITGIVRNLL